MKNMDPNSSGLMCVPARGDRSDGEGSFQCAVCNKQFDCIDTLDNHSREHSENNILQCFTCSSGFGNSTELVFHLRVHNIPRPFKCGLCHESFYDGKMLSEHLISTHEPLLPLYRCKLCQVSFHEMSSFNAHVIESHTEETKKYSCTYCHEKFHSIEALRNHDPCERKKFHFSAKSIGQPRVTDENESQDSIEIDRDKESGKEISLPRDRYSLRSTRSKVSNMRIKLKLKAKISVDKLRKSATVVKSGENTERRSQDKSSLTNSLHGLCAYYSVECVECHKVFNLEDQLKTHINEGDCQGHKCSLCSKTFHLEASLLRHMSKHMIRSGQSLNCSHCPKTFDSVNRYIRHAAIHARSLPFTCKVCGKSFAQSDHIIKHLKRMHKLAIGSKNMQSSCQNEMEESLSSAEQEEMETLNLSVSNANDVKSTGLCSECGEEFPSNNSLMLHKYQSHGQELYHIDCTKCQASFGSIDLLFRHIKDTQCEGYKCPLCNQSFEMELSFLRHEARHQIELKGENFTCRHCERKFKTAHQFIMHSEIHAESKPFVCSLCLTQHKNSELLFNHMKIYHEIYVDFSSTLDLSATPKPQSLDVQSKGDKANMSCSKVVVSELNEFSENADRSTDLPIDKLTCKDCGKSFSTLRGLACHRNWKYIENIYTVDCDKCKMSFKSLDLLSLHMFESGCEAYKCKLCSQTFTLESSYMRHVAKHEIDDAVAKPNSDGDSLVFNCQKCSKSFKSGCSYVRHVRTHALSMPFRCVICSQRFFYIELLHKHVKGKHGINISSCPGASEQQKNSGEQSCKVHHYSVFCRECKESFYNVQELEEHMSAGLCFGYSCHLCPESFAIQSQLVHHEIEEHLRSSNGELCCPKCLEKISSGSDYMQHAETHTEFLSFRCNLCGERFICQERLQVHISETHPGYEGRPLETSTDVSNSVPNFQCKICIRTFKSIGFLKLHESKHGKICCPTCSQHFACKRDLKKHRQAVHNELEVYQCGECGKSLSSEANVRRHMLIHSDEKPFQCQFCAKMFSNMDLIRSHLRSHSSERPHKCPICNYSCKHKHGLSRHIKTHDKTIGRDHICPTCGKGFRTRHNLLQHCKLHGKKTFQCKVCDASFVRKDYLDIHSRIHSFEKPYSCPVCGHSFAVASNMNSHIRRIHPDYIPQARKQSSAESGETDPASSAVDVSEMIVGRPDAPEEVPALMIDEQMAYAYQQL